MQPVTWPAAWPRRGAEGRSVVASAFLVTPETYRSVDQVILLASIGGGLMLLTLTLTRTLALTQEKRYRVKGVVCSV